MKGQESRPWLSVTSNGGVKRRRETRLRARAFRKPAFAATFRNAAQKSHMVREERGRNPPVQCKPPTKEVGGLSSFRRGHAGGVRRQTRPPKLDRRKKKDFGKIRQRRESHK